MVLAAAGGKAPASAAPSAAAVVLGGDDLLGHIASDQKIRHPAPHTEGAVLPVGKLKIGLHPAFLIPHIILSHNAQDGKAPQAAAAARANRASYQRTDR